MDAPGDTPDCGGCALQPPKFLLAPSSLYWNPLSALVFDDTAGLVVDDFELDGVPALAMFVTAITPPSPTNTAALTPAAMLRARQAG